MQCQSEYACLDDTQHPPHAGSLDLVYEVSDVMRDAESKLRTQAGPSFAEGEAAFRSVVYGVDVDLPSTVSCDVIAKMQHGFYSAIQHNPRSYQLVRDNDEPNKPNVNAKANANVNANAQHVLYRSLLDDSVRTIAAEVPLLTEFVKACTMTCASTFMQCVLQLINTTPITSADIGELQHLLEALADTTSTNNEKTSQKALTAKYVKQYVDNNAETLAAQVIDNVCVYLTEHGFKDSINRNQVGQDLVELGVQKARKARGYV